MHVFLYILSALFMLDSIVLIGRKSFTLGLVIMIAISIAFFVLAKYLDFFTSVTADGAGMYIKYTVLLGTFCFLLLAGFILSNARTTVTYNEDAIIVLGCGLNRDGSPSHTLKNRLDGCIDYYSRNPDCYVVVSGGMDRFNHMTEGAAMKKYLTENCIDRDRILTDEKAENTKENFEYAMQLLADKGIKTDNICFVTNSFHIFRATKYAEMAGFRHINALSVKTDRAVFVPAVLREVCAVALQIIFKY